MTEQFSWVPLPYCSLPRCPFPIKSLALSARVSLDNSFPSVRQELSFGPWKGSSFLQQPYCIDFLSFRRQKQSSLLRLWHWFSGKIPERTHTRPTTEHYKKRIKDKRAMPFTVDNTVPNLTESSISININRDSCF